MSTLILFIGTAGGHDPTHGITLPDGCEVSYDRRRLPEADVIVFHVPTLRRWWKPPKRKGQVWVGLSLESEVNYPNLAKPRFVREFDLMMTYRLDSDVSVPYVDYYSSAVNLARALRDPPRPKTQAAPASSFVSSGIDKSGRRAYLREIASQLPVDSYGSFMRTHRIENDMGRSSKLEAIASYRFNLAFENARDRDYVTEKFFDPLVAGSVPVYLGAPNVEEFAPGDRCFIDVTRFPDPRELARYLLALCENDDEYQSYLQWKAKPFRPGFERFIDAHAQPPLVRLLERVKEMRGGR